MTNSMTGYGVAEGPLGGGRLTIELRTVNHRYFNGQFRLPLSLQPFESELRTRLRERLERGNVTVRVRWIEPPPRSVSVKLNLERAQAVISALTELKTALNLAGEIDLGFVARQPDVLTLPDDDELDVDRGELVTLLDCALADVVQMRKREGAVLGADLERRLTTLQQHLTDVEARAPQRLEAERGRLRRAVSDLLDGKP
ncbi:MAG: YicC/YloC family endoribonuclease, partial [Acidimicrobiia bacterium]